MGSRRFSAPSIELLTKSDRKSLATVLTKITVFCTYSLVCLFIYCVLDELKMREVIKKSQTI